jgi:hypothetical protein
VLEAIPAPPAGHELALEIGLVQRDREAAVRVEVLERDPRGVRPVDRRPGRLVRRVQADPAEIGVEVKHQRMVSGGAAGVAGSVGGGGAAGVARSVGGGGAAGVLRSMVMAAV